MSAAHERIDIEVTEQVGGLALLAHALAGLAVPDGTELHYTEQGRATQRVYAAACWGPPMPSTATSRPARGPGR